jgi:hypothetical protein
MKLSPGSARRAWAPADRFLFLYALDRIARRDRAPGKTKVQKIIYLAERGAAGAGFPLPSFEFFRYHYGPFSKQLAEEAERMQAIGLVRKGEAYILTERARSVLQRWEERLRDYLGPAMAEIEAHADKAAGWSIDKLKRFVYKLPAQPPRWPEHAQTPIADIHTFITLLAPAEQDGLRAVDLPDDLYRDLFLDLAITDEDLAKSESVSDDATRKVAEALGWNVDSSGAAVPT